MVGRRTLLEYSPSHRVGWRNGRAFCHRRRRRAGPQCPMHKCGVLLPKSLGVGGAALHGGNFTEYRALVGRPWRGYLEGTVTEPAKKK